MSESWVEYLKFPNTLDGILRLSFVVIIAILIVANSLVFEEPYALRLAELHKMPWWRLLVAVALVMAGIWCPRVGIVVAFLVFLYFSDVEMLSKPIVL
jgi:hypothetical protein